MLGGLCVFALKKSRVDATPFVRGKWMPPTFFPTFLTHTSQPSAEFPLLLPRVPHGTIEAVATGETPTDRTLRQIDVASHMGRSWLGDLAAVESVSWGRLL